MKMVARLCLVVLVSVSLAVGLITIVRADPGGRAWGHGYFTDRHFQSSGFHQVILGGVGTISGKADFINTVLAKKSDGLARDKVGAEFIIQTMRANGTFDHSAPTSADITDWKAKINDPAVSISTESYVYSWNSGYSTPYNDDVFYQDVPVSATSIVFRVGGRIVYVLKQSCGNPIGEFPGLPPPTTGGDPPPVVPPTPPDGAVGVCVPMNFRVTVGTDANGNAVPMGVTITGPPPLSSRFYGPYTTSRTVDVTSPYTTGDSYTVTFKETRSYISYYTNDPIWDRSIPPRITGYTHTPHYAAARSGGSATIGPCYDYTLTPTLVTTPSGSPAVIEPDGLLSVKYSVLNSGITKSLPTTWQMTKMIVQPGQAVPAKTPSFPSSLAPCGTFFRDAGTTCTTPTSGSGVIFPKNSSTQLGNDSLTADDLEVGTRICYALSVQSYRPYTNPAHTVISTEWRHSIPACLIIGKKPKVQIWGGDLSVGKVFSGASIATANVQTSISAKSGPKMFGSWVEYGIFARGAIIGAGSGSAFAATDGMPGSTPPPPPCNYSRLSFTNYNNDASCSLVGKYTSAKTIPNVVASFPGSAPLPVGFSGKPSDLPSGTYNSGSLTLNTSTLVPGKSVILKVAGTVTINGDQTYSPGPYSVAGQLPQLVIIADKIIINDSVKAVDAWLVSKGDLLTCSSVPPLTSNTCKEQLTVNGPVMALRLLLFRTYGSGVGADSGTPAEIFNLRADTYLWATSRAVGNGRIQTVDTTELPPRL